MPYEQPDCYFRMKKEGGIWSFYVSLDEELWFKVTQSIAPQSDFDIIIPVVLPGHEVKPFVIPEYKPSQEYEDFKKTWPNQAEGDEDDIL
jgi:hypothetical protein